MSAISGRALCRLSVGATVMYPAIRSCVGIMSSAHTTADSSPFAPAWTIPRSGGSVEHLQLSQGEIFNPPAAVGGLVYCEIMDDDCLARQSAPRSCMRRW